MSVSRSRRCTLNSSRRTCSVGAALKRSTASVSCHTNRGRESGTDHAASGLRKMGHCRGRGVCTEPQFSLWHRQAHCTRGNNQMPCGRHLQQTAQHRRQLGKRSISSLAPALNPTLAHHRRNCAALRRHLEVQLGVDAGLPIKLESGQQVASAGVRSRSWREALCARSAP